MTGIIWKEPPPVKTGGRPRNEMLKKAMRENPGRWLLWGDAASLTVATRLRRAGFETRSSRRPDGRFDVYARMPEGVPAVDADPVLVAERARFEEARRRRVGGKP